MSNTNGFHPSSSSSSMSDSRINDTNKCTTAVNKRLKSKNLLLITVNETRSMKSMNKKSKSIDFKKKHLLHSDSNNNNSTKKLKHIPSTSTNHQETRSITHTDYCHSCGESYGEMISCETCQSNIHPLCTNPPISKEDLSKTSYFCDHCRARTKDKQPKLILPFRFDPKKTLHLNGLTKNQSTLDQIKLPAASNGRSLIQPSGEIKFRATSNNKPKPSSSSSTSNLKRKRSDSSSSTTFSLPPDPVKIPDPQLDALHRLFLSCQTEDFHGPSTTSNVFKYQTEKYCFTCRKSTIKQGPSIQCDYCPLTYHLDCLIPVMISLPTSKEKWMCPNHIEPILDRSLTTNNQFSAPERVKIHHRYSQIEENLIIQDFTQNRQRKDYLLSNTTNNQRLERIDISEIPKSIEEFYLKANSEQKPIRKVEQEEKRIQTVLPLVDTSSAYDPCIWDVLQAMLDHVIHGYNYEFSSFESSSLENDYHRIESSTENECNTFDRIDRLLQALNEPDYTSDQCDIQKIKTSSSEDQQNSSLSFLIDLTQFHSSHAALIHLYSQQVIYIRKHVIWFGSSPSNDICLNDFHHSHSCQSCSERHACLYYDQKRNLFELLNYSEYGTIVNELRYGSDHDRQENDYLYTCNCLIQPSYQSAWDGPAQIDQGTVIKIGCHEFLFYRHIVR